MRSTFEKQPQLESAFRPYCENGFATANTLIATKILLSQGLKKVDLTHDQMILRSFRSVKRIVHKYCPPLTNHLGAEDAAVHQVTEKECNRNLMWCWIGGFVLLLAASITYASKS